MTPLFFKLDSGLALMAIPDTEAHLDGHTILTSTYSIFLDSDISHPTMLTKRENELHLTKHSDPDYFGYIKFEEPGKLYTYTTDGKRTLDISETEEVIERITYIRNHPTLWHHLR